MAGHATEVVDAKTLWGGGGSPFRVSYGKMMMWFFLVSDALTFSGFLVMLGANKVKYSDIWPTSEEVFHHFPLAGDTHLPLIYVALMTFILIVSSVTMVLAVEAGHRMDKKGVIKWLAFTVVGGLFFLLSQVWEWSHFIHGSELGAVKVSSVDLKEAGISNEMAAEGLICQYSHVDEGKSHIIESIEKLGVSEDQAHKLEHNIHVLHDESNYRDRKLATKNVKDVLIESNVQLRLPLKKDNQYIQLTQEQSSKFIRNGELVYGANLDQNQYGVEQYAQFFFFVTGFHGFHVFSGVVFNLIILIMVVKGMMQRRGHYEMVEKTGLYWHFVDLVWVFVFTFYYLI